MSEVKEKTSSDRKDVFGSETQENGQPVSDTPYKKKV